MDLPKTLEIEESIDLQWQIDRFKAFFVSNEGDIDKHRPLEFFVKDSTGKKYWVKSKKDAEEYLR